MDPVIAAFDKVLATLHQNIDEILAVLPVEALNWQPTHYANSLYALATHVAGSQAFWIGQVVGKRPQERDRAAEFQATGDDVETLRARLRQVQALTHTVLDELSLADLSQEREARGKQHSVLACILHAIEHTALHQGHMELTWQLWQREAKEI